MDAVAFCPRFGLASLPSKPKLRKPFFSVKEIADGPSPLTSRQDITQLSIRADGNGRGQPPQMNTAAGRTAKIDENKVSKSPNSKNQEEMIALLRRIRSSIAKGNSTSPKAKSSSSSDAKSSSVSVLEAFRQSKKQVKGQQISRNEGDKSLAMRRDLVQKEQKLEKYPPMADRKLTRPPSNFIKRSPIPFPSSPRKKAEELTIEVSSASVGEEIVCQKLEEMKASELKELAKTRGMKGYSKLKKSELVELLKSSEESRSAANV